MGSTSLLKRHLVEKVPISNLCNQLGLYAIRSTAGSWSFLRTAKSVRHGRKSKAVEDAKDKKIEFLEAKLELRDSVMAERMEAHTVSKKRACENLKGHWLPHNSGDQPVDFVRD